MDRLIPKLLILLLSPIFLIIGEVRAGYALRPVAYSCRAEQKRAVKTSLPDIVPSAKAYRRYAEENDQGDKKSALNWQRTALFYFFRESFDIALYCLKKAYTIHSAGENYGKTPHILERIYSINQYKSRYAASAEIAGQAAEINKKLKRKKEVARWRLLQVQNLSKSEADNRQVAEIALQGGEEAAERGLWHKAKWFFDKAYEYYQKSPSGKNLNEIRKRRKYAWSKYRQKKRQIGSLIKEADALDNSGRMQAAVDKYVHIAAEYEMLGDDQEAYNYYSLIIRRYIGEYKHNPRALLARLSLSRGWLSVDLGNLEAVREAFFAVSEYYASRGKYKEAIIYAEDSAWYAMLTERGDKRKKAFHALLHAGINSNKDSQYDMSVIYSAVIGELNLAQGEFRDAIKSYLRLATKCRILQMPDAMRFCYGKAMEIGRDNRMLNILPKVWLEHDGRYIRTPGLMQSVLRNIFERAKTMNVADFPYQAFLGTASFEMPELQGLVRQFTHRQKVKEFLSRQA